MTIQHTITDDLDALLATLPPTIQETVKRLENCNELLEIVMDLGRLAEGRFPDGEVTLSTQPVTDADLHYVVEHIGKFGDDNRAGIERTLHRISALRNRSGKVIGLTCRIGRAVLGSIALIRDIVEQGQSILILGRPGVGKTTLLRETARVIADEANKRVIVVDTSNEIAGDGDIPHPGIGRARRMQVARTTEQHAVMIEAVENHMPEVIVIDEISSELEAMAARTIAERGVQLIATAHGSSLDNLLINPTLSDLVGGIQTVTLGDEEARRRHTQKSILERKAPPTFEVVIEQQSWQELIVHLDVADTVDTLLRGQAVIAEKRTRDEETSHVTIQRVSTGGMEVPTWSVGGFSSDISHFSPSPPSSDDFDRYGNGQRRSARQRSPRSKNAEDNHHFQENSQTRLKAPMATRNPLPDNAYQETPKLKTVRIYPLGVNRDRLAEAARILHVPIIITKHPHEADGVITLKNYYRRQSDRLQQLEQDRKLIIILKNNTVAQMQHALAHIFDIPLDRDDVQAALTDESNQEQILTTRALLATEDAIHQVLSKGLTTAELPPANAHIRHLQHEMATSYNLISRSRGKEPNRHVKIFQA